MRGNMMEYKNLDWLERVYGKLLTKMEAECSRIGEMIPYAPKNGRYFDVEHTPLGIGFWTNGFWPGMLWQMYHATGDEAYRAAAQDVEERLDTLLREPEAVDHDVGFLFLLSSVANYRETRNCDARRRGLLAAQLLAGRYNPAGGFIRAWNGPRQNKTTDRMGGGDGRGWMIVDCMMNIPLLYWASRELDDPRFSQIAVKHAKTAQQYLVRPDGSCNHIAAFDPDTGEYTGSPGGQGYAPGSSWSRGQAWAVYGFALSYRHTEDTSFLYTAKQCAHYCIANMALTDWIPLVDYRAPAAPMKYDTTAAVITACGLLEISEHVEDIEKRFYIDAACRILRACDERFCNWDPDEDSILDGGTSFYHDPDGKHTEVPVIYGDYYFIEAILRLKGNALFVW